MALGVLRLLDRLISLVTACGLHFLAVVGRSTWILWESGSCSAVEKGERSLDSRWHTFVFVEKCWVVLLPSGICFERVSMCRLIEKYMQLQQFDKLVHLGIL